MVPRVVDQRGQPASTRFLALRADDPENCRLPVARRLRLEELPRLVVCPELLLMLRAELGLVPVLVRVDARLLRHPSLECFDPGRVHAPARVSSSTCRTLTRLQLLPDLRGVKRME